MIWKKLTAKYKDKDQRKETVFVAKTHLAFFSRFYLVLIDRPSLETSHVEVESVQLSAHSTFSDEGARLKNGKIR